MPVTVPNNCWGHIKTIKIGLHTAQSFYIRLVVYKTNTNKTATDCSRFCLLAYAFVCYEQENEYTGC